MRLATERDLDFIMRETIEGAKHGHYVASLLDPRQAQEFRNQLKNVVHYMAMLRRTDRGDEQITAQLWIYGRKNDDQVGYLLVSEKLPGSIATDLELYKIGIRKDRRREGHGRRIVRLFVAVSPPTVKLYARCLPASETMFRLLKEVGFLHTNTMPLGTRELELCSREARK
ncbi:MAG TPA: hypothetical protein VFW53_04835 [Gallionella sp.]|nr:hypothetical protein [Gallionella sp.]